jgi:multiple sugar transport system permease protein/raffinose/stachyose/melibiose transport system permease protein
VLSFVLLVAVPSVLTIALSFTNFDGYSFKFHFVGLSNYRALFSDPQITASLYFTILYAVATTVIVTVIAIPLAAIVNIHFVGHKLVRAVFFFTSVPSLLVLALVWTYILSPLGSGVINYLLSGLFGAGPVQWLSDNHLAQLSVIMVGVWAQVGWHSVLYLGYLQSVPKDYYDAAVVDGASVMRRFFGITLPLLAPAMTVSVVLLMISGLRVYELPLALTQGGPVYSTYTVTQNILLYGVSNGKFGEGSALSAVFLALVIAVLFVILGALRHRESRLFR